MVRELEARHSVWFEKHPDGNVVWPKMNPAAGF
jgi:hypothetical protein